MSDDLRELVAAEHGLPQAAVGFLSGSTLSEVETSAQELNQLLGGRQDEPTPPTDLIAMALRAKNARKAKLAQVFLGRPRPQPRDEKGRWVGFDGGARQPLPEPRDPERDHNAAVARLGQRQMLGGVDFFE
jgi:hypothetical protein